MPSAWLRMNVFHPCDEGPLLRAIYLATLVWPTSMPSLRSSPWILGAPHNGLAMLISRISRRITNDTVGRPQRRRDFQRQYNLKPARCQRITVSGRTSASVSHILGGVCRLFPKMCDTLALVRPATGIRGGARGSRYRVGKVQVYHTFWETAGRRLPISVCQPTQIEVSWDWHAVAH